MPQRRSVPVRIPGTRARKRTGMLGTGRGDDPFRGEVGRRLAARRWKRLGRGVEVELVMRGVELHHPVTPFCLIMTINHDTSLPSGNSCFV